MLYTVCKYMQGTVTNNITKPNINLDIPEHPLPTLLPHWQSPPTAQYSKMLHQRHLHRYNA